MLDVGSYLLGWHVLLLSQQLGLFLKSGMLRMDWTRSHHEMSEKKKGGKKIRRKLPGMEQPAWCQ